MLGLFFYVKALWITALGEKETKTEIVFTSRTSLICSKNFRI